MSDPPSHELLQKGLLEYCEPGGVDFDGFSPEQYKFSQTGVNCATLNLFGWLFGSGDRQDELPYKLIRSIVVCGEHHQRQVEFSAYVAYNKLFGKLWEAGRHTQEDAVVVEILPTGDSSNDDPSKFDPQGFASYCHRHTLFPTWRRCFVSTCNVETGRTAFGQVVPEKTMKGAPVEKCFFHDDSDTAPRKNSELICESIVSAMQSLLTRLDTPSAVQSISFQFPSSSGALVLGDFLGAQISVELATRHVHELASKSLISHPCLRARLQEKITCTVGFDLQVKDALKFLALHQCALSFKNEPKRKEASVMDLRVQIDSEGLTGPSKQLCDQLKTTVDGEYHTVTGRSNLFEMRDVYLFTFVYQIKKTTTKHWALALKSVYDAYQFSLQNRKSTEYDTSGFLIVSNALASALTDISQIGSKDIRWYAVSGSPNDDNVAGLRGFRIMKTNFSVHTTIVFLNEDEIRRFHDTEARKFDFDVILAQYTRDYSQGQEQLAVKFLECLFSTASTYPKSEFSDRLNRVMGVYKSRFKDWILHYFNGGINHNKCIGIHVMDTQSVKLQGQITRYLRVDERVYSERLFAGPKPIEYSCLDDCVVPWYQENPNMQLQSYKGYTFQALPLPGAMDRSRKRKWFLYIHSIIMSFRYVALEGSELFQFARLDTMQSTLLNNWYRFLNVDFMREYIELFAEMKMGQEIPLSGTDKDSESKIKQAIAQALNIKIVEFTLGDNINIDYEEKAFEMDSCREFIPETNFMDPYWLPKDVPSFKEIPFNIPAWNKIEDVFEPKKRVEKEREENNKIKERPDLMAAASNDLLEKIKHTERMVPIEPITVYLLNMDNLVSKEDTEPLLKSLQQQSPAVQSRFGQSLNQYRTLLNTGFQVGLDPRIDIGRGFKVLNEQTTIGGLNVTNTLQLKANKGYLVNVPVPGSDNLFRTQFQTVQGMRRSLSDSGLHGMLRSIRDCLGHYMTHKADARVFDSPGEMNFFQAYSGGGTAQSLSWQGILNPNAFQFRTVKKFVNAFATKKPPTGCKFNQKFIELLRGLHTLFLARSGPPMSVETKKDSDDFLDHYVEDLQVLGAIFNLRFVVVLPCGISDSNSLYCEPCPQMHAIMHENGTKANYFDVFENTSNILSVDQTPLPQPLLVMLYPEHVYEGVNRVFWRPVLRYGSFDHEGEQQNEMRKLF
jgi:hypothetical protein